MNLSDKNPISQTAGSAFAEDVIIDWYNRHAGEHSTRSYGSLRFEPRLLGNLNILNRIMLPIEKRRRRDNQILRKIYRLYA